MARPNKRTVDFFPHYVKSGRTVFILESKFGNDGYAFWFKLLEILCDTDGHSFLAENPANWEFLLARTKVSEDLAYRIIETLVSLGKIDAKLWAKKVIWVENLIKNISEVYRNRNTPLPSKPEFSTSETPVKDSFPEENPNINDVFSTKNPQSRVEKSRVDIYPLQDIVDLWNSICVSLPKVIKLNETRRKKMKSRLSEWGAPDTWLATAESLFKRIQASSFLCGSSAHGWTATFDWLFESPSNWIKVSEGNYDDHRGANKAPQSPSAPQDGRLGIGEFRDATGRRTYGTGRYIIPEDAPPRPSDKHCWNASNNDWVLL